jgi:hypothetical protein
MPWLAKHLLSGVLSQTPGNFLAENTEKTSLKQDASTGAFPWLTMELALAACCPFEAMFGSPTLTNENRSLVSRLAWASNTDMRQVDLPKLSLGPHAEILEDKPDPYPVGRVRQPEGAGS